MAPFRESRRPNVKPTLIRNFILNLVSSDPIRLEDLPYPGWLTGPANSVASAEIYLANSAEECVQLETTGLQGVSFPMYLPRLVGVWAVNGAGDAAVLTYVAAEETEP